MPLQSNQPEPSLLLKYQPIDGKKPVQLELLLANMVVQVLLKNNVELREKVKRLIPSAPGQEEAFTTWLVSTLSHPTNFSSIDFESFTHLQSERCRQSLLALFAAGFSELCIPPDWKVDRTKKEVELRLGIQDLLELQNIAQKNTQRDDGKTTNTKKALEDYPDLKPKPIHLHKGAGDVSLAIELEKQTPDWRQIGVGDCLFVSIPKIFAPHVKKEHRRNKALKRVLKILGMFIGKELQKEFYQEPQHHLGSWLRKQHLTLNLNILYLYLRELPHWIRNYYLAGDQKSQFLNSRFFADDSIGRISGPEKEILDQLSFPHTFQHIFQTYFEETFVKGIFGKCRPLDLNANTSTGFTHFIPVDFEFLPKYFQEESITLMSSVRADSHLTHEAFFSCLKKDFQLLKKGGMIITDGKEQSYSFIYRIEELEALLSEEPEMEIWVITGKAPCFVRSVIILKKNQGKGLQEEDALKIPRKGCEIMPFKEFKKTSIFPELQEERKTKDRILNQHGGNTSVFFRPRIHGSDEKTYALLRKLNRRY